ncbi:MAG: quinolinate synthase NadA [Rickettsiales bacterium]|nr:quinolinate synthase NadA [Rickettsiales bacterium]
MNGILNYEQEIERLKKEKNAVILAHYYQDDEIQDIADFIGDSLDLSKKAKATDADVIVFCGVYFMAEVAKILSPDKTVIIPDLNAGCSLEKSCQPDAFSSFVKKHDDAIVISYINCSADIKALSDIIVTSSNAEKIIRSIDPKKKIIFAPDKYLGSYLIKKTGRDMILWNGTCIVHEQFSEKEVVKLKTRYPHSQVIAHPECPEHLLSHADHIGSTSSLLNHVNDNKGKDFIVLTESGIIHQMKKLAPSSNFYDVKAVAKDGVECTHCNTCPYMRLNNIEKLYKALNTLGPEISVNNQVFTKAKASLDRMLSY